MLNLNSKTLKTLLIACFLVGLTLSSSVQAQQLAARGIGFRGNYWDVVQGSGEILVRNYNGFSEIDVSGYGGSFYFFSRANETITYEFSVGGIGAVEVKEEFFNGENVDAVAVVPILFGVRTSFLGPNSRSALQPYAQFGGGAYVVSDIRVRDRFFDHEEVSVDSEARPGAYAGFGLDFMFNRHFGINWDMKYHWVDFEREGLDNGYQFGLGLNFAWGRCGR